MHSSNGIIANEKKNRAEVQIAEISALSEVYQTKNRWNNENYRQIYEHFCKRICLVEGNRAVVVVFSNIDGVACVFTFIIVLLINSANALFHDCSNKIFQRKNGKSCRAQPNSTR